MELVGEVVGRAPGRGAEQANPLRQVADGRRIGGRGLGPPPGPQIELDEELALGRIGDEAAAPVELIDQIEDALLEILGARGGEEGAADGQVHRRALALGDQEIGRLVNPIVHEAVGVPEADHQLFAERLPELTVQLLGRSAADGGERVDVDLVAGAGGEHHRGPRLEGEPVDLAHQEIHHVVGVPFGLDPAQIPGPRARLLVEPEELALVEGAEELEDEERVTARLLLDKSRGSAPSRRRSGARR